MQTALHYLLNYVLPVEEEMIKEKLKELTQGELLALLSIPNLKGIVYKEIIRRKNDDEF